MSAFCVMCGEELDEHLKRFCTDFHLPPLCGIPCIHLATELGRIEMYTPVAYTDALQGIARHYMGRELSGEELVQLVERRISPMAWEDYLKAWNG